MSKNTNPAACEHQLVFSPSLEHAAVCKRCGAIALIIPRDGQATNAIKWVLPGAVTANGAGAPAAE